MSRRINTAISLFAKLRAKFAIIDIPLKPIVLFGRKSEADVCNVRRYNQVM
jgi:hypothetical protein